MTYFKQTDPLWANIEYAPGCTFAKYGCFVTSLAMLCDKNPPETARILRENGCIDDSGILINPFKVAGLLGLSYLGVSLDKPDYDCIAETNYWDNKATRNIEQHFFVLKSDGSRSDPLGSWKANDYGIVSYRLFKAKESQMFTDLEVKYIKDNINDGNDYVATNGWELVAEAIKHAQNNFHSFEKQISDLKLECDGRDERIRYMQGIIDDKAAQIERLEQIPPEVVEKVVEKPVEKVVYIQPTPKQALEVIVECLRSLFVKK